MNKLEIVKQRVANLGDRGRDNAIIADLSWALDEVERLQRQLADAETCIGDIYCGGAAVNDRTAEYYQSYPAEAGGDDGV